MLIDLLFWLAVLCCAIAHVAIVRSVLRTSAAVPPESGRSGRRVLEVTWAVLPAMALAVVLAATWRAMHPQG